MKSPTNKAEEIRRAAAAVQTKSGRVSPAQVIHELKGRGIDASLPGVVMVLKRYGHQVSQKDERESRNAEARQTSDACVGPQDAPDDHRANVERIACEVLQSRTKPQKSRRTPSLSRQAIVRSLAGDNVVNDATVRLWNDLTLRMDGRPRLLARFKAAAMRVLCESLNGQLQGELSLNNVRTLTLPVAEVLGSAESEYAKRLCLDGLSTLTPAVARALATGNRYLSLDGLKSLAPAIAKVLSNQSGDGGIPILRLNGLREISAPCAAALAKHTGLIYVESLRNLTSYDLAHKLLNQRPGCEFSDVWYDNPSDWGGDDLVLDGLLNLSPQFLEALRTLAHTPRSRNRREGFRIGKGQLSLNGLKSISAAEVECLVLHEGELCLDGIKKLTDEASEVLAQHKGALSLNGLTTLTPTAERLFAKRKQDLSLRGLRKVPASIRALLPND